MPVFLLFLVSFSFASITEPHVKWGKTAISVCFGTAEHLSASTLSEEEKSFKINANDFLAFTEVQKNLLKQNVTREYTETKTGIHFVGWKDCKESLAMSEVILFRVEKPEYPEGSASLANGIARFMHNPSYPISIDKNYSNLKRFVLFKTFRDPIILKKVNNEESLTITALHEFGHVAGLRHEHADQDHYREDLNCKRQGFWSNDFLSTSSKKTSSYDPNSIMSYCFMLHRVRKVTGLEFKARNEKAKLFLTDPTLYTRTKNQFKVRIGLSQKDVHALKCLYVYNLETQKKICHKEFDL